MNHITYDIESLIKNDYKMYLKKPTSDFTQLNIRNFHINNRFKTELASLVGFDYNLINQFISILNEGVFNSLIFSKGDGVRTCFKYGDVAGAEVVAPSWVLLGQSVSNSTNNVLASVNIGNSLPSCNEMNNTYCYTLVEGTSTYFFLSQSYQLHIKGDVSPYQTIQFSTLINNFFAMLNPSSNLQEMNKETMTEIMNTYINLVSNFIELGTKHGLLWVKRTVQWNRDNGDGTSTPTDIFLDDDYLLEADKKDIEWKISTKPIFEAVDGTITLRDWFNIYFAFDVPFILSSGGGQSINIPAWGCCCITYPPILTDTVKTKLFNITDNQSYFSYVYDCSSNYVNPNSQLNRWITHQPFYIPTTDPYENTILELIFTFEINFSQTATLSFLNLNDISINNIYLMSAINQYNFIIAVDGDDVNFIMSYVMRSDEINLRLVYKDYDIFFVDSDEAERFDFKLKRVYINREYLKQSYLRIEWN